MAAEAVVVVHLTFIAFVVGGGFVAWRWARLLRLHLAAVAWGGAVAATPLGCPLTPLEKWLRRRSGGQPYEGGFTEHYVVKSVYGPGLTTFVALILTVGLVLVTAVAYTGYAKRRSVPSECSP